jgi:hypothetical protein
MLAAFTAGSEPATYVDTVRTGDVVPEMPLFLEADRYALVDLESAYQRAWDGIPNFVRDYLGGP